MYPWEDCIQRLALLKLNALLCAWSHLPFILLPCSAALREEGCCSQIKWAERDRSDERACKKRWSGSGARSAERTKLATQISLKGDMLLKLRNALYKLYLAHVKNKLPTGILIHIGLFCFWIPNFVVFFWTHRTIRQHTTETPVIITGTRFSGEILHYTFSPFRYQCVNCLYFQLWLVKYL